jgi:hypothetical protein
MCVVVFDGKKHLELDKKEGFCSIDFFFWQVFIVVVDWP